MSKEKKETVSAELNRESILKVDDKKLVKVEVPEWGGHVFVKSLTGRQRDIFEESFIATKKGKVTHSTKDARARLAIYACCDSSGKLLFNDSDLEWLTKKSSAALDRVFGVASKLSKIDSDDIEELVGN